MPKYAYPAVFTKEENGYSIQFPDLESCYTSAKDINEGIAMAEDVLCLTLYWREKEGKEIPAPAGVNEIAHAENEFVSLVACDTDWYRRFYDSKSVKKTLTIPGWLNDLAERNGINFSSVLQEALKAELKIG
ncbi:MAG: type II toxin-antitoxin system HicB family antitoxin [Lachnospiraceae bacterium]|nr:type II toxin-antitoxin system HicB family antitoxin [Lachnospiraceae bacterium]MCD8346702.1 type II toxin-antitoxin system HicB family antitoxin [Lachnospiraceae bacterium]